MQMHMAPEVLLGGTTSPASDQYALGVLLFFLVTGSYPVTGDTLNELIAAHRSGRRQLLRDLRADLPKGFIDVVERTMIPDPRERFASMGEMERSLAAVRRS